MTVTCASRRMRCVAAMLVYFVVALLLVVVSCARGGNAQCVEDGTVCAMVCADVTTMPDAVVDMCACASREAEGGGYEPPPQLLFVQSASSATLEDDVLTMHGVGPVVWFTDRPLRQAGMWTENEYLNLFTSPANSTALSPETELDEDTFAEDPPNAALTCTASDGSMVSMIVVLTLPSLESSDTLSYTVSVLEGPSASSMACSGVQLFVDGGKGCTCGDYSKGWFYGKACCNCYPYGSIYPSDDNPNGECGKSYTDCTVVPVAGGGQEICP